MSSKFGSVGVAAGKAFAGVAVAAGVVGAASVKLATDFDQAMTRIGTMANVPKSQLKGLSDGVLSLAGQVGFSPTSLANALYMTESSFQSMHIKGFNALDALKTAAQGAAIGGSDLLTTTQAMDALLASGLVNVKNYKGAMDAMVATVGSGEMTMQDFVDSLNGQQAIGQQFGATLADMSAALAVFGDNNMRGADAGSQFRMMLMALAKPAKGAADELKALGMTQSTLATDMQQGGVNKAIQDLHDRLDKAGITGSKVGAVLTTLFTRKGGVGIGEILSELDRFQSKYTDTQKLMGDPNSLADKWAEQQKQFSQQLKDLEAGAEAVGIRLGNFLIPQIMAVGKAVGDAWHSLNASTTAGSMFKEIGIGFDNKSMTNFDTGFSGVLEHIGASIRTLIDSAGQLGQKLGTALLPALKDIGQFITQSLWPSLQNLWKTLQGPLGDAVAAVVVAIRGFATILKDVVGPVLVAVTGFLKDNKAAVETLAIAVGIMWAGFKGYTILTAVKTAIAGMVTQAGTAVTAIRTLGGGSLAMGALMGGAVLGGVALLANGIMNYKSGVSQANTLTDQFNATIAKAPDSAKSYVSALDAVNQRLDELSKHVNNASIGNLADLFVGTFTGSTERQLAEYNQLGKSAKQLAADQAAATLKVNELAKAMNGPRLGSWDSFQKYQAIVQKMADSGYNFAGSIDVQKQAVASYITNVMNATPAQAALASYQALMADNTATATDKLNAYNTALEAMTGDAMGLIQSQDAAQKAINDLNASVAQGSTDLTGNTDAAIANRAAVLNAIQPILQHVEAMKKQGSTSQQVSLYAYGMASSLETQLVQLGFNKAAVDKLIQSLLKLPADKATKVAVPGVDTAKSKVDGLNSSLSKTPREVQINITAIDNAKSILDNIHQAAAELINLGFTPQGATNTIKATSINADGGHYAQIGNGVTRVWNEPETGGEAYIPLAPAKRARSLDIWAQTGKSLGVFANGGIISDRLTYDATPTVQQMGAALNGIGGALTVGGIGGGVARWMGVVLQALALNGASAIWAPRVLSQIQFESGGDPNIHQQVVDINTFNGSGGAQGLMQVLLSTFLSNHVAGTSMNIFDPLANVAAGIHHAIHEDPGGLSYLGQGHGYAMGGMASGWARVGEAGSEMVYLGRGGHVMSHRDSAGMGGTTVVIQALDSQDVERFMNRPGVTERFVSAIARARARGGAMAGF